MGMRLQHVPNSYKIIIADIDECESASDHDSICPRSSMCENTNGTYVCICINGTRMDEDENCTGMLLYCAKYFTLRTILNLTDINECEEGTHDCSNFAKCVNVPGDYDCHCLVGFEGDGMTCTGIISVT